MSSKTTINLRSPSYTGKEPVTVSVVRLFCTCLYANSLDDERTTRGLVRVTQFTEGGDPLRRWYETRKTIIRML